LIKVLTEEIYSGLGIIKMLNREGSPTAAATGIKRLLERFGYFSSVLQTNYIQKTGGGWGGDK